MNFKADYIFDFFLPRICPGCNKKLSIGEELICDDCLSSILVADDDRLQAEYDRNFGSSKVIKEFYAKYVFETDKTLQQIIHALKYNQRFKLGIFLGKIIAEGLKPKNWQIDVIVPVPIHHLKKAERGFNQSDYIAKGLSEGLNIPCSTKLIKRIRHTESQTKLNMNERAVNIANAFKVKAPEKILAKNVLIVDDVSTTGATLLECGKALISAGANSVCACSVGITDFVLTHPLKIVDREKFV